MYRANCHWLCGARREKADPNSWYGLDKNVFRSTRNNECRNRAEDLMSANDHRRRMEKRGQQSEFSVYEIEEELMVMRAVFRNRA